MRWLARCLESVLDNPIGVLEWRLLRRRVGNWRLWLTMKRPLDPVTWGAPVILTSPLAPYGLGALLACLRGLHVIGNEKVPFDALSLLAMASWFYVVAISLVLGATSITHEREQERWDQLRMTVLSRRDKGSGFLWGRLGPVWTSALITAALWWLLLPSYSALLTSYFETRASRSGLAIGTLVGLGVSLLVGEIGLLTSARFKRTAAAVVMAGLLAVPIALLGTACLLGAVLTVLELCQGNGRAGLIHQITRLIFFLFLFYALFINIREAMEDRLEA
jgi:hypothetical protein